MRTARTSLTVIVAAFFLALGGTGCATVRRMDDCRGVKVEAGQEPQGPGGRVFIGREFAETAGLMPADFRYSEIFRASWKP